MVSAKVTGARHLHELTAGLDLDLFVLFSSVAAVWGSGGQAAYAAGNAYLDALAQHRRALGLPATSVAWGPWSGGGMAADEAVADHLTGRGLALLTPDSALTALEQALLTDRTCVTVADVDWERFAPTFTFTRPSPLIADLPEVTTAQAATTDTYDRPEGELARALRDLPPAEQHRTLLDLVQSQVAAVLGHASPAGIDPERAFKDLGFDSLTAVDLRNRLAASTEVALPTTLVFDHPTPSALTTHLRDRLLGTDTAPGSTALSSAPSADDEPIAVIGMGCRFPGGIQSPEDLWDVLTAGEDRMSPFPDDRGWDVPGLLESTSAALGTPFAGRGGFIPDVAGFDAELFGISPREALAMDPQQRLLLETAWEALERAGIDPTSLRGTATGVYAGVSANGYGGSVHEADGDSAGYLLTGSTPSVASGRLSYVLGLEGPPSPSTPPAPPPWSPCTWPARPCGPASATRPSRAGPPSWPTPRRSWSSPASAASPPTETASPSPRRPTAPAGPKAPACWSSCAGPRPNAAATASSPSSEAPPSTRTAPPTA